MIDINGYSPVVNHYFFLSREAFKDCYHGWQTRRKAIKKNTLEAFGGLLGIEDVVAVCDEETDALLRKYSGERLYRWPEHHEAELLGEISQRLSILRQLS